MKPEVGSTKLTQIDDESYNCLKTKVYTDILQYYEEIKDLSYSG